VPHDQSQESCREQQDRELERPGWIRRNGEYQGGRPVYEVTELGQRVSLDVLDGQTADRPLQ
jgi:DNA-binding PadR family transcriptional regulator